MVPTKALLASLIYSDIFDFPLTKDELMRYFLYEKMTEKHLTLLLSQHKDIEEKNGFYFLKGRHGLVEKRQERMQESKKKLHNARSIIHLLSFIPTIMLIGVSGSVAVGNADKDDDVDLFIITKAGTLWITRLLVTLMLLLIGKKRGRKSTFSPDTMCANMFMDERDLTLPHIKQNLYTAHEVVQMSSIFVRDSMDKFFIQNNAWVTLYIPNTIIEQIKMSTQKTHGIITAIEQLAKSMQLLYMKRHRTNEITTQHVLAFHPHDKQEHILHVFDEKMKKYEI